MTLYLCNCERAYNIIDLKKRMVYDFKKWYGICKVKNYKGGK